MVKMTLAQYKGLTKRDIEAIRNAKRFFSATQLSDITGLNVLTICWIWSSEDE